MRLQRAQVTWSQLRVGIFALICLGFLLWVLLFSGSGFRAVRNQFSVYTILDSAAGLKPGGTVRLAGIEVGQVKNVEFVREEGMDRVRIEIKLNKDAAQRLRSDSVVQIKSVGFTESRYIEISLGTLKGISVTSGVTLAGVAPIDIMPVALNQAIAVGERMNSFLTRFEHLIVQMESGNGTFAKLLGDAEFYTHLNRATEGASDLMGELNHGRGTIPQLLSEGQLAENIKQSAASTAVWSKQMAQGEGTLGKLSTDPELLNRMLDLMTKWERVMTSLEARLERLDSVMASTDALVQKVDHGNGTAAKLVNTPDLHDQIHETAEKMEQFVNLAQSGEGTVGRLVSDPTLAKQITASTESVAALTEKLNTPGNTLDKLATGADLLERLQRTTSQLESILTKINSGDGSLGKLTNDRQTSENLSQLITNLKTLIADVQANPEKYVNLKVKLF